MLDPVSPTVQTSVGPPATLSSDDEKGRIRTVTVTFSVFDPDVEGAAVAGAVLVIGVAVGVVAGVERAEECGSRWDCSCWCEAWATCWVAKGGDTGLVFVGVGVETEILRRLLCCCPMALVAPDKVELTAVVLE